MNLVLKTEQQRNARKEITLISSSFHCWAENLVWLSNLWRRKENLIRKQQHSSTKWLWFFFEPSYTAGPVYCSYMPASMERSIFFFH